MPHQERRTGRLRREDMHTACGRLEKASQILRAASEQQRWCKRAELISEANALVTQTLESLEPYGFDDFVFTGGALRSFQKAAEDGHPRIRQLSWWLLKARLIMWRGHPRLMVWTIRLS